IADGIILARVVRTSPLPSPNRLASYQKVNLMRVELLSGNAPVSLELNHYFVSGVREGKKSGEYGAPEMKSGDRVLLFYGRRYKEQESPIGLCANISAPNTGDVGAVYDNHCRKLATGKEILELTR